MNINVTNKNLEVFTNCDVVFLGMKPGFLSEAIDQCKDNAGFNKTITVVSMLAGVNISRLKQVTDYLDFIIKSDRCFLTHSLFR